MTLDRRTLLAAAAGTATVAAVRPAAAQGQRPGQPDPRWPPPERIVLWPGRPPASPATLPVPRPELSGRSGEWRDIWMRGTAIPDVGVFRPARPDGRGVLVIPGGGYAGVALRNEGIDVALALNAHSITAFVLNYRLPGEGWLDRSNTPLADAQRATRLIRANAPRYRIDPARLGVLGFSAGGHLAGSLATLGDLRTYAPVDAADRQSARPASAGLMYAVSNMDAGRSHGGSRDNLIGPAADPRMIERYAVERHIAGAPPLFLLHTEDDTVVPVVNTLDMLAAARGSRVPVDAHIMTRGGHGFGVRLPRTLPASLWPELYACWLA